MKKFFRRLYVWVDDFIDEHYGLFVGILAVLLCVVTGCLVYRLWTVNLTRVAAIIKDWWDKPSAARVLLVLILLFKLIWKWAQSVADEYDGYTGRSRKS